jgi:Thiamine monophosphate kinase
VRVKTFGRREADEMRKTITLVGFVFLLGACELTLPVNGRMNDGSEVFTGTATGYLDGAGTLTITSSRGRTCSGDFVYVTGRTGEGVFTCSDGQSGPFQFVSTGSRGTGTGVIGGQPFTFTFG